jgi:UDP-N-acetylglucosamine 2-epimerase (non-hydrolysing)
MRVLSVVGARPNYMKVAPVVEALAAAEHESILVHTGQHYDREMSDLFFEQLGMPAPDINLQVGAASHAQQTARILERVEPVIEQYTPDWVLVAGDVNSTLAAALAAAKLNVKLAHLEAGLRSRDKTMPEEINRKVVDHISDLLLTPSADADDNLAREGIAPTAIVRVGNLMIDTLLKHLPIAQNIGHCKALGLKVRGYALATLHRASNTDDASIFRGILSALATISQSIPVVMTIHPRTKNRVAEYLVPLQSRYPALYTIPPQGYLEFLSLEADAALVLTDSGGIQEETTVLGVPCLTLRHNTERPITIECGTNALVGTDEQSIVTSAHRVLHEHAKGHRNEHKVPERWDGKSAGRVVQALAGRVT